MKRSLVPWYFLGSSLTILGAFFGYVGVKMFVAHLHMKLAASLTLFGVVLTVWGLVVIFRCFRAP